MSDGHFALLLEAARAGDDDAFESLIGPLQEPAFRLACGMLLDREAAEDALQEATLSAWRALPHLRPDTESLRPWFLTIVANRCRSLRRTRWWSVLRGLPRRHADGVSHERGSSERLDLEQALRQLNLKSRAAVVLRFYFGLSHAEIASVIGSSEQAARARLHRALRQMRLHIDDECHEPSRAGREEPSHTAEEAGV